MLVGINIGPPPNKGCKALERATKKLLKLVDGKIEVKPMPSGYTEDPFEAFFCIGGDNIAYWDTLEFEVTSNAIKMGIPCFGLGLDISPRLGRFTNIPYDMCRYMCLMDAVLLRSSGSCRIADSIGIPNIKIPDLAWILDPVEYTGYEVKDNTIAISMYQDIKDIDSYIRGIVWTLKSKGYNVVILRETSHDIRIDGVDSTPEDATWEQNVSILKKCKALITTGFHAAIAGYKAGIPVLMLPVQEKSYWLAEELGLQEPIPFNAVQSSEYIAYEVQRLIDNPPNPILPDHTNTPNIIRGLLNEYVPGFSIN